MNTICTNYMNKIHHHPIATPAATTSAINQYVVVCIRGHFSAMCVCDVKKNFVYARIVRLCRLETIIRMMILDTISQIKVLPVAANRSQEKCQFAENPPCMNSYVTWRPLSHFHRAPKFCLTNYKHH